MKFDEIKCAENNNIDYTNIGNRDVGISISIDIHSKNEKSSGEVAAVVYLTKRGDIVTAFMSPEYRLSQIVLDKIEESKQWLIEHCDVCEREVDG